MKLKNLGVRCKWQTESICKIIQGKKQTRKKNVRSWKKRGKFAVKKHWKSLLICEPVYPIFKQIFSLKIGRIFPWKCPLSTIREFGSRVEWKSIFTSESTYRILKKLFSLKISLVVSENGPLFTAHISPVSLERKFLLISEPTSQVIKKIIRIL